MTEYDYSPEGYQRYMENQSRVARWVDNTEAHAHEFRAPFGMRSDIDEDEMRDDLERDVDGSRYRHGHSRRHGLNDFHEMSAGLSTVGIDGHYPYTRPPVPHSPFQAAVPQSYPPAGHLPGQTAYNLYPSYIPQPQPQMSGYTTPSPLVSASATPPPPIVIQRASRHRSRHHHDHHGHHHSSSNSSSGSKPKSRTRTYIIQPATTSAPMQYTVPSSYPSQYRVASPPQTAPPVYASGYQPLTSPTVAPTGVVSPTPTYGYPTQSFTTNGKTITSIPGYVIVSPKGRDVKVMYA